MAPKHCMKRVNWPMAVTKNAKNMPAKTLQLKTVVPAHAWTDAALKEGYATQGGRYPPGRTASLYPQRQASSVAPYPFPLHTHSAGALQPDGSPRERRLPLPRSAPQKTTCPDRGGSLRHLS